MSQFEAIKRIREVTGCGLAQAEDIADRLESGKYPVTGRTGPHWERD